MLCVFSPPDKFKNPFVFVFQFDNTVELDKEEELDTRNTTTTTTNEQNNNNSDSDENDSVLSLERNLKANLKKKNDKHYMMLIDSLPEISMQDLEVCLKIKD